MAIKDYLQQDTTTKRSGLKSYLPATQQVQGAEQILAQAGYEAPKESGWSLFGKGFKNVLGGVLNILRTGEYAVGGLLAGKGPIAGIKEKISPSTVLLGEKRDEDKLWSQRGIAALAIDVLLDPTTYLTFGVGGATKLSTKGGQILLNKSGQKLIKTMVGKGVSEAAARRAMARVIQEGGESAATKYIGKSGLKFMGQVFIPASQFQKAGKLLGKLPGAGAVNRVGSGFSKAFIPFKEIDKMPVKLGGKGMYTDFLYKPFVRETRDKIFKEIDSVKLAAAKAYKKYGLDVGQEIGEKVEKQVLTGDTFLDDIVKWMGREQDEILQIEKATGKKIGEIKGYLRHYLTPEGRDFVAKGGDFLSGIPKPLRAKLGAAKPRKLEGTIKEINEYFRKTHGIKNFFEPDAFKAFAMRKAEHVKYMNTHRFLEATKARFGTRLDKAKTTITDGVKLVESTNPQLKGWLMPEPIVKHLDDTLKTLTNEESLKGFVGVYDKMLGFWKKNVTGVWPAFHTRNAIGGTFNNWLAGVRLQDNLLNERILRGSDEIMKNKFGTEYTGKQILDLMERFGVRGQPGMMDVARQTDEVIKEITAGKLKKIGLKTSNAPRWAMEQVEDRLRGPLFINRLRNGATPAEAAKDVFKFHFDYLPETGLTPFERNVMKRVMPFYVWTRNNVPLQLEQMMKQPGKYANLEKLRQSMFDKGEMEDFKDLPDWIKESFTAPLPWKDEIGRTLWAQLDLPLEDINKLPISSSGIREIASSLTPFLKFPMERYFNKNMYFGGEIVNPDLPREMQTRKVTNALRWLPNPIKKFLNYQEVSYRDWSNKEEKTFIKRYEMDARKLHTLMSFLGRYYSTLVGVSEEDVPAQWKVSRYVGGVPIRVFDVPGEKERKISEQEAQVQEMMNYLKRHNIIPYKENESTKSGLKQYLK